MKNIMSILAVSAIAITLVGCNKTKKTSNRLIKAGEWKVTELSVDGTNEDELPTWEISDCDIYNESCTGEWENDEGGHTEFIWQFRDKGDTFEISRQAEEDEHGHSHSHDHADEEVAEQCYNFSGVYEVVSSSKDEMEFKSTVTTGYNGQEVVIKISKQ